MRKILCAAFSLAMSLCLVGCVSSGSSRDWASFTAGGYPADALTSVAGDMANQLSKSYAPGRTSVFIGREGGSVEPLGAALESMLRARGFTILNQPGGGLSASYALDQVEGSTWYSRLSLSDGVTISRAWRQDASGRLVPGALSRGRQ